MFTEIKEMCTFIFIDDFYSDFSAFLLIVCLKDLAIESSAKFFFPSDDIVFDELVRNFWIHCFDKFY